MVEHHYETMKHCVDFCLSKMKFIKNERDMLIREINRIEDSMRGLHGVSYEGDRIKVSAENDRLGERLAQLEALRNELSDLIERGTEHYYTVFKLCQMPNLGCYILWQNKVEQRTYAQIGSDLNYNEDYIYQLSRGGYVDLYFAMPEDFRKIAIPNAMPQ